jgi:hypothetical protein
MKVYGHENSRRWLHIHGQPPTWLLRGTLSPEHLAEDGQLAARPADLGLLAAYAAQLGHHLPRHLVLLHSKHENDQHP